MLHDKTKRSCFGNTRLITQTKTAKRSKNNCSVFFCHVCVLFQTTCEHIKIFGLSLFILFPLIFRTDVFFYLFVYSKVKTRRCRHGRRRGETRGSWGVSHARPESQSSHCRFDFFIISFLLFKTKSRRIGDDEPEMKYTVYNMITAWLYKL